MQHKTQCCKVAWCLYSANPNGFQTLTTILIYSQTQIKTMNISEQYKTRGSWLIRVQRPVMCGRPSFGHSLFYNHKIWDTHFSDLLLSAPPNWKLAIFNCMLSSYCCFVVYHHIIFLCGLSFNNLCLTFHIHCLYFL